MTLSSTVDISSTYSNYGNLTIILNAYSKSRFFSVSLELVVPIINNLFSGFFGGLLTNTNIVYNIGFENLGPKSTYSNILSISSNITNDNGDLYASSNIFAIALIFPNSENPTKLSGVINLA